MNVRAVNDEPFCFQTQSANWRRFWLALVIALTSTLIGCEDDGRPELYPLTGKVWVGDQAAHGAVITLHSETDNPLGSPNPFGRVDAEGRYSLTTFSTSDGVPAGRFRVTVIWPENPEARGPSPDRLKGRYGDAATTPLEVTVEAGMTELPDFRLEKS